MTTTPTTLSGVIGARLPGGQGFRGWALCPQTDFLSWCRYLWHEALPLHEWDTHHIVASNQLFGPTPSWSMSLDHRTSLDLSHVGWAIVLGTEENALTILQRKTHKPRPLTRVLFAGKHVGYVERISYEQEFTGPVTVAWGDTYYWVARCEVTPGPATPEPEWERITSGNPPDDAPPWPWTPGAADALSERPAQASSQREEQEWWQ